MANIKQPLPMIRVVGLGGSLAERSASRMALKIGLKGAEEAGAVIDIFDVRTLNLPLYDPDLSEIPGAARHFADSVAGAQGLLWSVPLVVPIPGAWRVFDDDGKALDEGVERQLRALGREVWRAARRFALDGVCDYAEGGGALVKPKERMTSS